MPKEKQIEQEDLILQQAKDIIKMRSIRKQLEDGICDNCNELLEEYRNKLYTSGDCCQSPYVCGNAEREARNIKRKIKKCRCLAKDKL